MELYENSAALETAANAFKDTFGTSWSFFDDTVGDPAIYNFVLEVAEVCETKPLTNKFVGIEGTLIVLELDKEARYEQIELEEYDPEPTFIMEDGTTIRLDTTDLAFNEFATDSTFVKEFLENPEKYEVQAEDEDWHD